MLAAPDEDHAWAAFQHKAFPVVIMASSPAMPLATRAAGVVCGITFEEYLLRSVVESSGITSPLTKRTRWVVMRAPATTITLTSRNASFSSRWRKAKVNCAVLWEFTSIGAVSMRKSCASFTSDLRIPGGAQGRRFVRNLDGADSERALRQAGAEVLPSFDNVSDLLRTLTEAAGTPQSIRDQLKEARSNHGLVDVLLREHFGISAFHQLTEETEPSEPSVPSF